MFSAARADRAVRFYEMLKHTKGKFHGQPFTLLSWQDRIIRDVYGTLRPDGTRQYKFVYIEVAKKMEKVSWQPRRRCTTCLQMARKAGRSTGARRTGTRHPWCTTWRWR